MSRAIGEAIARRGVERLVYFHTDHFEPWRTPDGRAAIGAENQEEIAGFIDAMANLPYGRRLSLFYKPHLSFGMRDGPDAIRLPGDSIAFYRRPDEQVAMASESMRALAAAGHDIQLHLHHENYTWCTSMVHADVRDYLATPEGRNLDDSRFEFALRLLLDVLRTETGQPFDRWFLVHGHWALNGSDSSSCNITREIEILLRNGCRGDFTFPAGRGQANPRYAAPFLVDAVDAPKGYDLPGAKPALAFAAGVRAKNRFFIWSSPAKHEAVSLDLYSPTTRKRLDDAQDAAVGMVKTGYAEGGTLYIKTHAHSMHPGHGGNGRHRLFPLAQPKVRAVLDGILDAASKRGVPVVFQSAPEVHDALVDARVPAHPLPPLPLCDVTTMQAPPAPILIDTLGSADAKNGSTAPAGPSAPSTAEWVNDTGADFLRWRLESGGDAEAGLDESYVRRVGNRIFVPHYEREVMYYLLTELPGRSAYVEIGSGIGSLPMLIGAYGAKAFGIERNGTRHAVGETLRRHLGAGNREIARNVRLIRGEFPQASAGKTGADAVAIVTNLVGKMTAKGQEALMRGLASYDAVLVDIDRFVVQRRSDSERTFLLRRFEEFGFTEAKRAIDLGERGQYYLLRPSPAARAAAQRYVAKLRWRGLAGRFARGALQTLRAPFGRRKQGG